MKNLQNIHFYIIGSGIIGLSVAEYFSRDNNNKVSLFSDENPLAGSNAAAANLATKGQIFGRDPHFQGKLDAKKIYKTWLKNLIAECSFPIELNNFFRIGHGIDSFCNKIDRDKHLKRVLQNKEELFARNLPTDYVKPFEENKIVYKEEAWVDATVLLNLLKSVLNIRNILFKKENFAKKCFEEIIYKNEKNIIIFCTGAWTKQLLLNLGLPTPEGFKKTERLTFGSTFNSISDHTEFISSSSPKYLSPPGLTTEESPTVLYEKISEELKQKVTYSGNNLSQYISSSSVKVSSISNLNHIPNIYKNELKIKNDSLLQLANCSQGSETRKGKALKERTGLRVGYGHSEIVINSINIENTNTHAIICCGAHKSGYLFAPMAGKLIEQKIGQKNLG